MLTLTAVLPLAAQEWGMQQYTSDNGLPQNSVLNVVMDNEGYAWMTTEGGLVRYDGNRPERIALPIPDGGPQRMRDIIGLGSDGRFVVRDSHSRTFIIEKGRVKPYGRMDIDEDPYPFCRGDMPTMEAYLFNMRHRWLGARSFDWQDYTKTLFRLSDHDWLATSTLGLLHMRDTTLVGVIPTAPQDRFFALNGHLFGFNAQNQPLFVDVAARTMHTITLVGVTPPASGQPGLFFDNWQSTNSTPTVRVGSELYVLRASAANDTLFATHVPITLPTGTDVIAIAADLEHGVVLVGTNTQGLFVYKRMPMRTLRCPAEAVDGNNINYVQIVLDSARVAVRGGGDLHVFNSAGCDTTSSGLERFHYLGTARDRIGRIWYGLDSAIMTYHPLTGARERIDPHTGRGTYPVAFLEDGDSMWVALNSGIGHVRNGRFVLVQPQPNRASNVLHYALRRGPDGAFWYCNCQGVFRLNTRTGEGTPVKGMEGRCARTMQRIGKRMYIGTYGTGPWVYENDTVIKLPTDRMGYLDHVHSFMPDSLGFLWLSTNHGLFRVRQREIDAYLAGTATDIYYAYYGKSAGISNTEFNGGCDPTYVRLANGYASFPTLDGLVWFKPEQIPDPYPTAPVRLVDVLVDGRPVSDSAIIALRPDKHELIVRFSVSYWGEPANVQLVYQLPGVQDEWYPIAPDQRELRFQHLPYGDHTLTVRKLGAPANGDRGDLVLHFTVRRPYYLSAWFFLLCGGAALGLYITALRVNRLRLRRKNIALGRMVRQRTLELQSINQRLERSVTVKERVVSIISHDIVTPLRFIARVAHKVQDVSDSTPAVEIAGTLHDIALSSDKLYMNARNLLNWIKHQGGHIELRRMNVAMAALVDDTLGPVRELASTKGTELLNVVPPEDVFNTDRDVVGIILQNLVNNALNHGEGGRVVISGEQRPDAYHLIVADDGPGLPTRTVNAIRLLQHGSGRRSALEPDVLGLGYIIITELLQLLGGELAIADNAGRGTRITVILPAVGQAVQPLPVARGA